MEHVFQTGGYDTLGKRLVRIAQLAPKYLVTQTPFMTVVVQVLFLLFGARRRVQQLMQTNAYVGKLLGFKRTQHEAPGITWGHRG
ncbi:MAG: hypothetical protein JNG84_12995, partial [Archangium sp.]|nr:hypothetical protein [Archangium sp.]